MKEQFIYSHSNFLSDLLSFYFSYLNKPLYCSFCRITPPSLLKIFCSTLSAFSFLLASLLYKNVISTR